MIHLSCKVFEKLTFPPTFIISKAETLVILSKKAVGDRVE